MLLGLIVAEASGRPFKEFVRTEIFDPLGMADTWFLSDDPRAPRARGYTLDSEVVRSVGLDPGLEADAAGLIDTTGAQEQSDAAAGIITTVLAATFVSRIYRAPFSPPAGSTPRKE